MASFSLFLISHSQSQPCNPAQYFGKRVRINHSEVVFLHRVSRSRISGRSYLSRVLFVGPSFGRVEEIYHAFVVSTWVGAVNYLQKETLSLPMPRQSWTKRSASFGFNLSQFFSRQINQSIMMMMITLGHLCLYVSLNESQYYSVSRKFQEYQIESCMSLLMMIALTDAQPSAHLSLASFPSFLPFEQIESPHVIQNRSVEHLGQI